MRCVNCQEFCINPNLCRSALDLRCLLRVPRFARPAKTLCGTNQRKAREVNAMAEILVSQYDRLSLTKAKMLYLQFGAKVHEQLKEMGYEKA